MCRSSHTHVPIDELAMKKTKLAEQGALAVTWGKKRVYELCMKRQTAQGEYRDGFWVIYREN